MLLGLRFYRYRINIQVNVYCYYSTGILLVGILSAMQPYDGREFIAIIVEIYKPVDRHKGPGENLALINRKKKTGAVDLSKIFDEKTATRQLAHPRFIPHYLPFPFISPRQARSPLLLYIIFVFS